MKLKWKCAVIFFFVVLSQNKYNYLICGSILILFQYYYIIYFVLEISSSLSTIKC